MPDGPRTIRFGVFEADLTAGELRRNGSKVKLQEQPFQVLAALLERPGEVVTKEELRERIWKDDTFVDFDRSLATAVNKIRQSLGDSATRPRFVETVPKRGYRFVGFAGGGAGGEVSESNGARGEWASKQCLFGLPLIHIATGYDPLTGRMRIAKGIIAIGSIAVGGVAAGGISIGAIAIGGISAGITSLGGIALALWMAFGAVTVGLDPHGVVAIGPGGTRVMEAVVEQGVALTAVPLTSYPGIERSPTFSPDGHQVAFSWNGREQDNFDIYVQLVGGLDPKRLTQDPRMDYSPAWSPDGRSVAFLRRVDTSLDAVMLISALGGPERKVAEISGWFLTADLLHGLCWTPDGRWLIASDKPSPDEPFHLTLISLDSGQKRRLTSPPDRAWGDSEPAVTRDGRRLVFRRTVGIPGSGDLFLADLDSDYSVRGNPRQITFTPGWAQDPAWTPRDDAIVFVDDFRLWKLDLVESAQPERLPFPGIEALTPAFSTQGNRFAYQRLSRNYDIWQVNVGGAEGSPGPAMSPVSSTSFDAHAEYSPDGRRLVFQSERSGSREIWVSNRDGSDAVQLTNFGKPEASSPDWSPDGDRIVFDSNAEDHWSIYVVSSDGGRPQRITSRKGSSPEWSRDGAWIYFSSGEPGDSQIWKMPANGGPAVQLTKQGGTQPAESPDGRFLYYLKGGRPFHSLWRMPSGGGPEERVLERVSRSAFAVVDGGVYFLFEQAGEDDIVLHYLDLGTSRSKPIVSLGPNVFLWLAATPDGRSVLFTRVEETSDLMMVQGWE